MQIYKVIVRLRSNIYKLCTSLSTLLLSLLLVSLVCIGNISSHYALSQVESGNGGTGLLPHSVSGLTIQIPQNWSVHYRNNPNANIVSFCLRADCTGALIDVNSIVVPPGSYLTSDSVIKIEKSFPLQNLQVPQFAGVYATTKFTVPGASSGQDRMGAGVILIANDHLYVVHFISTNELWNTFAPIAAYISNNLLNDPNNAAGMERTISDASAASIVGYCTNMKIIANMHVGPHVEHWDPQCNQYD
jgi:hypothetical protein